MAAIFASSRSWFLTNPNMKREKGKTMVLTMMSLLLLIVYKSMFVFASNLHEVTLLFVLLFFGIDNLYVEYFFPPQISRGNQWSTHCTSSVVMVTS